jgi:predicted nucleic acid-binding protein
MIVVSDTTPLRHLIAIGEAELLASLYGTVIVPRAVWAELQAEATPLAVKIWLAAPPAWLEVRSSHSALSDESALDALDAGEREAIQLAAELRADLLLMDDREGRSFALRRQLPVTGTLGVLERADVVGLLSDLPSTLARLEASGFYLSARLRDSVLARHRSRHGIGS